MLIFEEGLEFSPDFQMVALRTKCQELAEPTSFHKTTGRKIKEKKKEMQGLMALFAG